MADVEFAGQQFRMAERVGVMPLMRFAKVAKAGVDSDDLSGLAAMYDLLEQVIDPSDWVRFQQHADDSRADGDELMGVVGRVFEALSKRPTSRPSDSSVGSQSGTPRSEAVLSLPDSGGFAEQIAAEEAAGRPDRALVLLETWEKRSA